MTFDDAKAELPAFHALNVQNRTVSVKTSKASKASAQISAPVMIARMMSMTSASASAGRGRSSRASSSLPLPQAETANVQVTRSGLERFEWSHLDRTESIRRRKIPALRSVWNHRKQSQQSILSCTGFILL